MVTLRSLNLKCPHCEAEQGVLFVLKEQGSTKTIECNKCEQRFYVRQDPEIAKRRAKLMEAKQNIELELTRLYRYQETVSKE